MIEVVPYNPNWPKMFEKEAEKIKKALGDNCIEVHHVGSTAVPGLSAKPKIDVIVVVFDMDLVFKPLELIGYRGKGELNIPFRQYFRKKDPSINLHVYEKDNPEIKLNLMFRNYLRDNPKMRDDYIELKTKLLSKKESHEKKDGVFSGYNLGKNAFIKKVLKDAGFDGLCLRFATHYDEWEAFHRIRKTLIFDKLGVEYYINHPSIKDPHYKHFVLYKGVQIIGIANLERLTKNEVALRNIAIDTPYQKKGYGGYLLKLLEKWIKEKGYRTIRLHASSDAIEFYKHYGYKDMSWSDVSVNPDSISLGKYLL